jgi:hypothetical protein
VLELHEGFEDPRALCGCHARAAIGDAELDGAFHALCAQRDLSIFWCVADRILDEILEHAPQKPVIRLHDELLGLDCKSNARSLRAKLELEPNFLDEVAHDDGAETRREDLGRRGGGDHGCVK